MKQPTEYILADDGVFPNSHLPVLHYEQVLTLPDEFPEVAMKELFQKNGWTNNWKSGIFNYQHYHSNTHEVIGVIKGSTKLLLGGKHGTTIIIKKGDVIVIPAGVAHKNQGNKDDVTCIGGYPDGKEYNMNYGKPEERPVADRRIAMVMLPVTGPIDGTTDPLLDIWTRYTVR